MSDGEGFQPSPLSPMCSSISSEADGTPNIRRALEEGGEDNLLALLTRPRGQCGGYGGLLNYTEFAAMVRPLQWPEEDVEDCWYDVVRGVGMSEVTDMTRVAEVVWSYYSAAPFLPPDRVAGGVLGLLLPPPLPAAPPSAPTPQWHADASRMTATSDAAVQVGDCVVAVEKSAVRQLNSDGGVDSPKSTSISSSSSSSSSSARASRRPIASKCPDGKRRGRSKDRQTPETKPPSALPGRPRPVHSSERAAALLCSSFKRYSVPTESSRQKHTVSPASRPTTGRHRSPPARRSARGSLVIEDKQPPAADGQTALRADKVSAVFERLYAQAKRAASSDFAHLVPSTGTLVEVGATGTNGAATAMTAAARERAELEQCTFKPALTPYLNERFAKERAARPNSFKKPTRASLARLLDVSGDHDRLADAPDTPRVEVRPTPGPSAHVPPGYVEEVARLRAAAVHRAGAGCPADFSQTLRAAFVSKAQQASEERQRLMDTTAVPILRLPLSDANEIGNGNDVGTLSSTPGSARSCIDVRLASPLPRREPQATAHRSQDCSYAARSTRLARTTFLALENPRRCENWKPSRAPSSCGSSDGGSDRIARFKEHPPAYRSY